MKTKDLKWDFREFVGVTSFKIYKMTIIMLDIFMPKIEFDRAGPYEISSLGVISNHDLL